MVDSSGGGHVVRKEYFECADVAHIYSIEAWVFLVISVLVWVFGTKRGAPIRKINFTLVSTALYLASTVFFAAKHDLFCGVLPSSAHPLRDELLLSRFIVYAIFLVTLVVIVTIRAAEDTIDIIGHVILAAISALFWTFAAISNGDLQRFWMYNSAIYAGLLCLHMISNNRSYKCSDPIYAARMIHLTVLYVLCFYAATLLGPWFLDHIDLVQQEWFLSVVDEVLVGLIFITIVHFGGARRIEEEMSRVRPGDVSAMTPSQRQQFILNEHLLEI